MMLNPSKADAIQNDPTVLRCINYAASFECSVLDVVNMYAYRATKPSELPKVYDPVGPKCDEWIARTVIGARHVIAAWGNGPYEVPGGRLRVEHVVDLVRHCGVEMSCLAVTEKHGRPRHPLYLRKDLRPIGGWTI
jgi:hypothetical protein